MTTMDEEGVSFPIPVASTETTEQAALRTFLENLFQGRTDIDAIQISGQLITYTRDHVLSSLAAIRRTAALKAKRRMSADKLAEETGLSKATVTRLITENRNY